MSGISPLLFTLLTYPREWYHITNIAEPTPASILYPILPYPSFILLPFSNHSFSDFCTGRPLIISESISNMPLQKSPPKSQRVTDRKTSVEQPNLKHWRRSLHTISELAPQHSVSQGIAASSSTGSSNAALDGSNGILSSKSTKTARRRSLPNQYSTSQRGYIKSPTVSRPTAATPTSQRSVADVSNVKGSARNNPRRRSMPSSFEPRGRSLSPVAEGELSRQPVQQDQLQSPEPSGSRFRGKQSDGKVQGKGQEGGWNARRERELIKREQALLDANARRERERLGLNIGSTSSVPSLTATRNTTANARAVDQSRHYSPSVPSNQAMLTVPGRRNSRGRDGRQVKGSIIDGRLFQDVGSSQSRAIPELRTSVSAQATSDGRWVSYNEDDFVDPRSSSSLQTSTSSTRSSSTKSSLSTGSGAMRPSRRSSLSYTRAAEHPLRQNPVADQQAPSKQQITQATQVRVEAGRQTSVQEFGQLPACGGRIQKALDASDVIFRENPDKRGLGSRRVSREEAGRQTSVQEFGQSREEAGEAQRRAAREKIKERVRRANELEEEKEKELVKERKKKSGRGTEKGCRGMVCGLFRKSL